MSTSSLNLKLIIVFIIIVAFVNCNKYSRYSNSGTDTTSISQNQTETFYNFIYDFMNKSDFQIERSKIQGWKFINYYNGYDYTMHFFNSFKIPEDEFKKDLVDDKYLTIIDLRTNIKTILKFTKQDKTWNLIKQLKSDFKTDTIIDFETFLYHFSKDKAFMLEHIKFPLKHGTVNDENDYSDTIVYLNSEDIGMYDFFEDSKLVFHHENNYENSDKILVNIGGIDNGISIYYYFEKFDNSWYLVEDDDYSM